MKPRIFIGSSVEGLDVAYAIQENLDFDANITVWTQGVFKLSSNSLDDLIQALENFDLGIFIFKPDDILHMRNEQFNVIRDNVIFELGLFLGKLGKEHVFFVIPDDVANFHLPTDLLGVMPGKYKSKREDGNLNAALGPFCNQVRARIKNFLYENLLDLANESDEIKKIAIEKDECWEMFLFAALLRKRMIPITSSLNEIEKGYKFKKTVHYTLKQFSIWFQSALSDIIRIVDIAKKLYLIEMEKSFGAPGVSGNTFEIKAVVDQIASLCKELLNWEIDLQSIKLPEELVEVPQLMQGWSKNIIGEFNRLPGLLEYGFSEENLKKEGPVNIEITFEEPNNIEKINNIIDDLIIKVEKGILDID